jgi:hypothetical protein
LINLNSTVTNSIIEITYHEIIHITIQNLIQDYNIDHWSKEQLVDLIYGNFFSLKPRVQKSTEKSPQIKLLFSQFFPNIEKIIVETSKLGKEKL